MNERAGFVCGVINVLRLLHRVVPPINQGKPQVELINSDGVKNVHLLIQVAARITGFRGLRQAI